MLPPIQVPELVLVREIPFLRRALGGEASAQERLPPVRQHEVCKCEGQQLVAQLAGQSNLPDAKGNVRSNCFL